MKRSGQLYTVGLWLAKPGKESEFISAWDEFAKWTIEHYKSAENGQLLQDDENPRRLISFGPWKIAQSVQDCAVRKSSLNS